MLNSLLSYATTATATVLPGTDSPESSASPTTKERRRRSSTTVHSSSRRKRDERRAARRGSVGITHSSKSASESALKDRRSSHTPPLPAGHSSGKSSSFADRRSPKRERMPVSGSRTKSMVLSSVIIEDTRHPKLTKQTSGASQTLTPTPTSSGLSVSSGETGAGRSMRHVSEMVATYCSALEDFTERMKQEGDVLASALGILNKNMLLDAHDYAVKLVVGKYNLSSAKEISTVDNLLHSWICKRKRAENRTMLTMLLIKVADDVYYSEMKQLKKGIKAGRPDLSKEKEDAIMDAVSVECAKTVKMFDSQCSDEPAAVVKSVKRRMREDMATLKEMHTLQMAAAVASTRMAATRGSSKRRQKRHSLPARSVLPIGRSARGGADLRSSELPIIASTSKPSFLRKCESAIIEEEEIKELPEEMEVEVELEEGSSGSDVRATVAGRHFDWEASFFALLEEWQRVFEECNAQTEKKTRLFVPTKNGSSEGKEDDEIATVGIDSAVVTESIERLEKAMKKLLLGIKGLREKLVKGRKSEYKKFCSKASLVKETAEKKAELLRKLSDASRIYKAMSASLRCSVKAAKTVAQLTKERKQWSAKVQALTKRVRSTFGKGATLKDLSAKDPVSAEMLTKAGDMNIAIAALMKNGDSDEDSAVVIEKCDLNLRRLSTEIAAFKTESGAEIDALATSGSGTRLSTELIVLCQSWAVERGKQLRSQQTESAKSLSKLMHAMEELWTSTSMPVAGGITHGFVESGSESPTAAATAAAGRRSGRRRMSSLKMYLYEPFVPTKEDLVGDVYCKIGKREDTTVEERYCVFSFERGMYFVFTDARYFLGGGAPLVFGKLQNGIRFISSMIAEVNPGTTVPTKGSAITFASGDLFYFADFSRYRQWKNYCFRGFQ